MRKLPPNPYSDAEMQAIMPVAMRLFVGALDRLAANPALAALGPRGLAVRLGITEEDAEGVLHLVGGLGCVKPRRLRLTAVRPDCLRVAAVMLRQMAEADGIEGLPRRG